MAKKVNSDNEMFELDTSYTPEMVEVTPTYSEVKEEQGSKTTKKDTPLINPLRNERISVRLIPKQYCKGINNTKHPLWGGMAETSTRTYTVPRSQSGSLVSVLTPEEEKFLEQYMGLEEGALSVFKRKDNYWLPGTEFGISKVSLKKHDNYLNLSDPEDFIRYKILLANVDVIAPSIKEMEDRPKATYQFVCVSEEDTENASTEKMSATMKSYMEFGKISEDFDKLKYIIEAIEGKPIANNTKKEFLKNKVNELIQTNAKVFLSVIKDELLDTKVLIKKAASSGIISVRGTFLYLTEGNIPLCGNNQEPTLNNAAVFLNLPKNQELLLTIQAKLKK